MRAVLIVLDSLGVGELPDAALYGDEGSNTFLHIVEKANPNLPNLKKLGLYDILGLAKTKGAAFAKANEMSAAKDTLTGHFEICGLVSKTGCKTYPNGFPQDIIAQLTKEFGRGVLANVAGSGTELINQYGAEHMSTGKPIVYTSADSVLQIAAHTDIIPLEQLYDFCLKARQIMQGENKVGRVIARPFIGTCADNFVRTKDRRDYALPPSKTVLDLIKNSGKEVVAVGKIEDIFSGNGITKSIHTKDNAEGIAAIKQVLREDFDGLCFVNLVDFDMLYGHRNDVRGYASALEEFDKALPDILELIKGDDLLIITADHGCDPTTPSTDHSREYVPVLFFGKAVKAGDYSIINMADIGATIARQLNVPYDLEGKTLIE